MDFIARARIIKYHHEFIKKYGIASHQALGWQRKNNQLLRFEKLIEGLELEDSTVMDIGCGTGDLLNYLVSQKIQCYYTGIDHLKDFIEYAGNMYKDQGTARFLLGDFWTADLGQYDFVIASGSLSYHHSDPNFIYKMIAHLFSLSKKAFAFNLMERTEKNDAGLLSYNKNEIVDFCQKLSSQVIVKDAYLDSDFAIIMSQHSL